MLLLLLLALSLMLGAKSIPFHDVTQALFSDCNRVDCVIVRDARLPRTLAAARVRGSRASRTMTQSTRLQSLNKACVTS